MDYIHDAAGKIEQVTSVEVDRTLTKYDGDGQTLYQYKGGYDEETSEYSLNRYTAYFVRSSVLGGAVISEPNFQGGKRKTYVYAGGSVLAVQETGSPNNFVRWEHRDPSGTSFRNSDSENGYFSYQTSQEFDPMGANTELSTPISGGGAIPTEDLVSSLLYPNQPPAWSGQRVNYTVNGMPVPVEYFMSFTPASGWGFALSEINARRSNNIIGHRQINEGTTIIPNAGENGEGDDLVINRIRIENIYDTSFAFSTTLIPFQDHPPDIHRFDGRGGIVIVRPARSKHQQKKFEECLAAPLAKYTRAVDSINAKSQINYNYQSRNYVLAAFGLGTGAIMRENPKSIRIRTTFSNVTTNRVQLWAGVVLATGSYILVRTQTLAIEAEDFKKETDNFIDEYDKCSALFPNDWVRPPTFNEYIQDNRTSPFRTTHPFSNLFHIAADEHFQFQFIR